MKKIIIEIDSNERGAALVMRHEGEAKGKHEQLLNMLVQTAIQGVGEFLKSKDETNTVIVEQPAGDGGSLQDFIAEAEQIHTNRTQKN